MSAEARKYEDYARECLRQARLAQTPQLRDRLLDLARVWTDAATTETNAARTVPPLGEMISPSGRHLRSSSENNPQRR